MSTLKRWSGHLLKGLLALIAALVAAVFIVLWKSLPETKGTVRVPGLGAPVKVARDALGIPTIEAAVPEDAARALGFLHGQERFFQMDLLRRASAGELSGLFGPIALGVDRAVRIHRFRAAARRVIESMGPEERRVVDAYAEGVASGLNELGVKPFEYWLLRAKPEPWRSEDTVLVIFSMWLDLQPANGEPDRSRAVVRDLFPPEVAEYLLSAADPFQAAIDGSVIDPPALPKSPGPPPVTITANTTSSLFLASHAATHTTAPHSPSPPARTNSTSQALVDMWTWSVGGLAGELGIRIGPAVELDPDYSLGSNTWAVAGSRTATGAAIVADDMHLGLSVPSIWYRATTITSGERMDGVTLPGTPAFIIGSNGHVTWGFNNSQIDTSDVVIIEPDPADPSRYLVPGGSENFEDFEETITVNGGPAETLKARWTRWGPVIGKDHFGRTIAFLWVAHQPGAANFGLMRMARAQSTTEAVVVAQQAGMPAQNILIGDSAGSIAWTIAARVPRRDGLDGSAPVSLARGGGWNGWLSPEETPAIIDPPDGILWGANARMVGGIHLLALGDGSYQNSVRAWRIHERLAEVKDTKPADMIALQLDVRAPLMDFWRDLLAATLTPDETFADPSRETMRRLAVEWNGDADTASAGYRLIREFRREVVNRTTAIVFARCREAYDGFRSHRFTEERIVRDLVTSRPAAWLPADHTGWEALLLESADSVIAAAKKAGPLEQYRWGDYNRLSMRHPLGGAVPLLGKLLNMRAVPLSGDGSTVNALLRGHGPSERMVVSPGQETEGILHIPGGQSGNPASSHYDSSHSGWLSGEPTPLQPGRAESNLLLTP